MAEPIIPVEKKKPPQNLPVKPKPPAKPKPHRKPKPHGKPKRAGKLKHPKKAEPINPHEV